LPLVIVVVPTLQAGSVLCDCLASLQRQTMRDFDVVVVDNSGRKAVRSGEAASFGYRVIENERNVGFGAAINQAIRQTESDYVATLNDDAVADPGWLEALVSRMAAKPDNGMAASCVLLAGTGSLDSSGMLICRDGSSKQRGHGDPEDKWSGRRDALLPSGSAALYRRAMLNETGLFDESFFLYCEDTDLGLRGRWAGWGCIYVPEARVEHRYSQTAGKASNLKAYYVERNRLFVALKCFPAAMLPAVIPVSTLRYYWHWRAMRAGHGVAGAYRTSGGSSLMLAVYVLRAHLSAAWHFFGLRWQYRAIRRKARVDGGTFQVILRENTISPREVAAQ
jgi:GT2 family glycosyltransferase